MRLIDADELHDCIMDNDIHNGIMSVKNVYEFIEEAPTIDAVPVKHGMWIHNDEWWEFICTSCHRGIGNIKEYKYCPNCGARMDGDEQ